MNIPFHVDTQCLVVLSRCSASSGHMEAVVSEVVEQMLREVSIAEIQAERERLAEEKRRIEEARLVRDSETP